MVSARLESDNSIGADQQVIKALAYGVLTILALAIGGSIILWVAYNELIHQQPQYARLPYVGLFGVAPAMMAVGLHWGRKSLRHFRVRRTMPSAVLSE